MSSTPEIKAVLFDYGMVLSGPAYPPAWDNMISISGLTPEAFGASYWAPRRDYDRGELSGRDYWQAVSPSSGSSAIDLLIQADTDLWTQPNTPMLNWAIALQIAGIRTGILSNLGDAMTEGVLSRFDFSGFHHRTWSYTTRRAKPELEIYAHAIAGLETPAENILFLDDREENIEGARQSGIQTLLYTTHEAFEAEMRARGLAALLTPLNWIAPSMQFGVLVALACPIGCGGGPNPNIRYTPPGTYRFQVTASSTSGIQIVQSVTATLIVTN